MADFDKAISKVLKHEGGYANDPSDRGGETYKGIARNFWPKWDGWSTVDKLKAQKGFPRILNDSVSLHASVVKFYNIRFWDKIGGDLINEQDIAFKLVDTAVNMGIVPAVKLAEGVVGEKQDGIIDDKTINKLNSL